MKRLARNLKLALLWFGNLAEDHVIAETGGSYEQHKTSMERYFRDRDSILKTP
jgi:hypothetical protein